MATETGGQKHVSGFLVGNGGVVRVVVSALWGLGGLVCVWVCGGGGGGCSVLTVCVYCRVCSVLCVCTDTGALLCIYSDTVMRPTTNMLVLFLVGGAQGQCVVWEEIKERAKRGFKFILKSSESEAEGANVAAPRHTHSRQTPTHRH